MVWDIGLKFGICTSLLVTRLGVEYRKCDQDLISGDPQYFCAKAILAVWYFRIGDHKSNMFLKVSMMNGGNFFSEFKVATGAL